MGSWANPKYKEVDYAKYCEKCAYRDLPDYKEPCDTCLTKFVNLGTDKPVNFKEVKKYDTK